MCLFQKNFHLHLKVFNCIKWWDSQNWQQPLFSPYKTNHLWSPSTTRDLLRGGRGMGCMQQATLGFNINQLWYSHNICIYQEVNFLVNAFIMAVKWSVWKTAATMQKSEANQWLKFIRASPKVNHAWKVSLWLYPSVNHKSNSAICWGQIENCSTNQRPGEGGSVEAHDKKLIMLLELPGHQQSWFWLHRTVLIFHWELIQMWYFSVQGWYKTQIYIYHISLKKQQIKFQQMTPDLTKIQKICYRKSYSVLSSM